MTVSRSRFDDSWTDTAAAKFRTQHSLGLIEAAARACGVYAGRWTGSAEEQAIKVAIGNARWFVYPGPSAWVAAPSDHAGEPDLADAVVLALSAKETSVPTAAWGSLLAGIDLHTPINDNPESSPPLLRS